MKKVKAKGTLREYMMWPLVVAGLNILLAFVLLYIDKTAGQLGLAFAFLVSVLAAVVYIYYRKRMNKALVSFASEYAHIQKMLLDEMYVPYGLADAQGHILWMNDEFRKIAEKENRVLFDMFTDIKQEVFFEEGQQVTVHSEYNGRKYQIDIRKVSFDGNAGEILFHKKAGQAAEMYAVYLKDETEKLAYIQQLWDQELVVAIIYLDNYDEALESVEEVRRSLLSALVDRKVNKYIAAYGGLLRKTEKDKYFAVLPQKYMAKMREERFALLEDVKTVNIGNDMAVTISMGLGIGGDSYTQNYEYARAAIDMALGRGGDQAVVKTQERIDYYGGKSQSTERYTRVKARVKAHALRELIETKEKVFIMGHQRSDIDAVGAAIGIYRAAKVSGRKAYIILDQRIPSIKPICDRLEESPDYEEELFIGTPRAKELIDDNSVLVVVDVNRPSYTESPDLLKRTKHIVVLDHHRQTREIISNAVLSYVEPYASSACEMVAEILQYYSDNVRLKALDADAMYAGIMIDTNGFTTKTGVRTFEAAAFLRRSGADVVRVRKMFRDDINDYQIRTETVSKARLFHQQYAIGICQGETQENITVVSAQAANELLNIRNVKASFVLSQVDDTIFISARSIDEVNVQIIMEQLGGGGHMSVAGAQLKEVSFDEAVGQLEEVLVRMEENGEI